VGCEVCSAQNSRFIQAFQKRQPILTRCLNRNQNKLKTFDRKDIFKNRDNRISKPSVTEDPTDSIQSPLPEYEKTRIYAIMLQTDLKNILIQKTVDNNKSRILSFVKNHRLFVCTIAFPFYGDAT